MDTITQEDYSPNTESELTSPFPPKRPRTDCTHDNGGKSSFAFPELVTFWKTVGSSSSTSTWQENAGLLRAAEGGDMEEQLQDAQFIVIPIASLTTSHTGSSDVSSISAERCFKLLVRDEQPPIPPTDKLSSTVPDDEDRAVAETCTSKEGNADTSSQPDSKLLGEACEDEALGNNSAGALVQNSASQIQALQVSSSDYGLRYQSGCTSENESNQEWQEPGFTETIVFSEEDNSLISFTDSFYSNPQRSGNLAQICENIAICKQETEDQVNENCTSMNSHEPEGSIVSYDVVSLRNIPIERLSLDADDFCGEKGEEAGAKMIARAQSKTSDHTTGTPVPAQICQGPAEGDNDASPFAVIEPAIWSETDREEEKSCNSGSAAAGVQSLPSVKVCTMETPLPLCAHVRLSKEVLTLNQNGKSDHQSLTQQREDGKEDLCQSFTEPLAGSITTNETHNNSSCHGETGVSHDTVGHQLKESDRSGCFHVSPERMKTKEVEYLQAEITRTDGTTEIKENGGMTSFEEEIRTGEQPENSQDTEEATETSSGNSIRHRTEGKTSKYDDKLTHVDDALKNILGFLSDHPYNAVILPTEEAAGEEERKEEASVGAERDMYGSSEIVVERELVHQQQSQQKEDMPEEWISERTEGHNLTLGSQREQEHKLSCVSDFQHTAETYVVDNRDDPSTLTAFPFNGRLPGGIDTFERIQLSLDGDEDGLSESLLLSSLPEQLLTSPQQQLHKHEEVPQEEEEETSGRHPENKAKGFSGIYSMCNEVSDCISAAAAEDIALVRPEQPANGGRTHNSPECFQGDFQSSVPPSSEGPASDVDDSLTFEKKELFDKVLKELNLFFSISTSDFTRDSGASSSEQCVRVSGASDRDNCKEDLSIAKLGCYGDPSPDSGLEMCAGDPDVSPTCEGEQEVPLGSHLCTEETHKEPPQRKRWSPSFPGPPLLEQLGYRQPEQTRRLEPLRTCNRPIRVGLSKRAKTKHLHPPPCRGASLP